MVFFLSRESQFEPVSNWMDTDKDKKKTCMELGICGSVGDLGTD